MVDKLDLALELYGQAKAFIDTAGYSEEVQWQRARSFLDLTETDFLRETAWVIFCSGFREDIVRRCFDLLSLCFCDWESADEIVTNSKPCRSTALVLFGNHRKIDAVIGAARRVKDVGFSELKEAVLDDPIAELQNFPYIGPITSWHLAKNLGFRVAKPDRHLARLSSLLGFSDAHGLCEAVASSTGDSVDVVDIIFWRFAVSGYNTSIPG